MGTYLNQLSGLKELRYKESDRIRSIVVNLKKIGFNIKSFDETITIKQKLVLLNTVKKINA